MNKIDLTKLKNSISFETLLTHLNFENINVVKGRATCLLHKSDNKTSFSFNEETFHCFGCLKSGDKIKLIEYARNCSFQEALKFLCQLTGTPYEPGKEKKQDYSRYSEEMFPTQYVEMLAQKTVQEYYNSRIRLIEKYQFMYSEIYRSISENVPKFKKRVFKILYKIDNMLNDLKYESKNGI